MKTTKIIAQK